MPKRIVIGISGASGVIYGVRMLQRLRGKGFETHLVISEAGRTNIEIETVINDVRERVGLQGQSIVRIDE